MKSRVYLWSDLSQLFLKWEMSQKIIVEKIKTIIWYSIFFFSENCAVYEIRLKNMLG